MKPGQALGPRREADICTRYQNGEKARFLADEFGIELGTVYQHEALVRLKELPGIGDFSAELILLRGAGEPGHLPGHEPRLARAVALAYGLDSPPETGEVEKIAERWRPYRTWVSLLPRVALEEETGEIAGSTGKVVSVGRARSGGDV